MPGVWGRLKCGPIEAIRLPLMIMSTLCFITGEPPHHNAPAWMIVVPVGAAGVYVRLNATSCCPVPSALIFLSLPAVMYSMVCESACHDGMSETSFVI